MKHRFNFWKVSTSHSSCRKAFHFMLEDGKDPLTTAFSQFPVLRGVPLQEDLKDEKGVIIGTVKTKFLCVRDGEPFSV